MRRSFGLTLIGVAALAAVVALVTLLIPAHRQAERLREQTAAERALGALQVPATFTPLINHDPRVQVCMDSAVQRCFTAPGDPAEAVSAARVVLARVTSGQVTASCQASNPLPHSPVSCSLHASLRGGGTLVVDLFARPVRTDVPLAARTYSGSYVEVRVG
jgi:hypothetical protein